MMGGYEPPYGFPLRRQGGCKKDETDCNETWGGFHACCPGNSVCPGASETIFNNVCCPTESDCTAPLEAEPHCANPSWVLYNVSVEHGWFCCEKDMTGFGTDDPKDAVGCIKGTPNNRHYTILLPVDQVFASSTMFVHPSTSTSVLSTSSITSSVSHSTTPSNTAGSAEPSSGSSSKTNVGAIAGGAVGGVAGLALVAGALFYFLRKRRRGETQYVEAPASEVKPPLPEQHSYQPHSSPLSELSSSERPTELPT